MTFPANAKNFSIQESFETPKDSFTKFFGNVRKRISDGNSWYSIPPPPLRPSPLPPCSQKLFRYPKVSGTQNSPTKFSILWDNKSSTGNRYTPSLLPSPSYSWTFRIANIPSNTKENLHDISRSCETTYFRRKIVTSPLLSRTLMDTRNFLERKKSLLRFFWSCKTKEIWRAVVKIVCYL